MVSAYADNVMAGVTEPVWDPSSRVDTVIDDSTPGTSIYNYTVNNTSEIDPYGEPTSVSAIAIGPGPGDGSLIVDWEMPFYTEGGIDPNSIVAPSGWLVEIEDIGTPNPSRGWGGIAAWQQPGDPFYEFLTDALDGSNSALPAEFAQLFLDATQVIHWYIQPDDYDDTGCMMYPGGVSGNGETGCNWWWNPVEYDGITYPGLVDAILPDNSLGGFSMAAPTGPAVAAPYQASWFLLPVLSGDPPAPGNPNPSGAFPTTGLPTQAPLPGSLALLLAGAGGLGMTWRRRRKSDS
jgi:hypothetical protein